MSNSKHIYRILLIFLLLILFPIYFHTNQKTIPETPPSVPTPSEPQVIVETKPTISPVSKQELTYDQITQQLEIWHKESPNITEIGTYGTSREGRKLTYLRVGKKNGPKILIHSAIHGNEKNSAVVSLGVIQKLLDNYLADSKITELFQTRDIYFIPVVSPDSFTHNRRYDEGVDPNRNFNNRNLGEKQSITCIQALKDFFLQHNFKAVMSCHNYGRIYFYPWGYSSKHTETHEDYMRILGEMKQASGYRFAQLDHRSAPPYYGYETDWYYNHGAFSIVNEIGRNFYVNPREVETEINANYPAFVIFIRESPLVRN